MIQTYIICCVIFFGDVMTLGGGVKIQFYFGVYSRLYNNISISLSTIKIKKKIKNVL